MADADLERLAVEAGVRAEDIRDLGDVGLDTEQILVLLTDPLSVIEWTVEISTTGDVQAADDQAMVLAAGQESPRAMGLLPRPDGHGTVETKHIGSAFNLECASLFLKTEFAWKGFEIVSSHIQHRSATTPIGSGSGWRVQPSQEGSSGWISEPMTYRREAKADWKLVVPMQNAEVQSGTAWIQHTVNGLGFSYVETGGWP
jgi:hypothetical protein